MPGPSLVSVPVVVLMALEMDRFPLPPSVNPKVAPLMAVPELSVRVPASELMREALPSVMGTEQVLASARLRKAPPLAMPVPFKVSALVRFAFPLTCNAAPAVTLALPAPKALLLFCALNTPALTVVPPL